MAHGGFVPASTVLAYKALWCCPTGSRKSRSPLSGYARTDQARSNPWFSFQGCDTDLPPCVTVGRTVVLYFDARNSTRNAGTV
jgi:hypothetical protein